MSDQFVNLHTHSFYSLLQAPVAPRDIIARAEEMAQPAVALTDSGNGHGLLEFYQTARKKESLKAILGAELAVAKDSRFEKRAGIDGSEGHIVLLAINDEGYHNLIKLLSFANLEGFYYQPRVDLELLEKYQAGLVALSGTQKGAIGQTWLRQGNQMAKNMITTWQKIFSSERFFLEIVSRDTSDQRSLNEWKVSVSEELNCPLVVTSDARYLLPQDEEAAEIFYCIGTNQVVGESGHQPAMADNHFKSWEEIANQLSYLPADILKQARQNTLKIADQAQVDIVFGQALLPDAIVADNTTAAQQLAQNCQENLDRLYPSDQDSDLHKNASDRLEYELSIINEMGFASYFLIVADVVNFAHSQDIMVGPGRGSAAGSIVSYLLSITSVDPLRYDLIFERFLNPARISMPDIDIDFSDERREEIFHYVVEKYGSNRVSKVCTFGTLAAKAALKDVGRAMGVSFDRMNKATKLLPNKPGFVLDDVAQQADFMNMVERSKDLQKVLLIAKKLEGAVRHVSVHACAVIIGKDDLYTHTPLQWAPGTDNLKITQFPYTQLEDLGLLKMDFLGLKNLSVLEKTIDMVRTTQKKEVDLNSLPMNDKKTFDMIARGETTGVFQFESSGMRRYLKDLKPTELEDLIAMNALYRPGPMKYIPDYISGKHKKKKIVYLHDDLKPILEKTYGIAVYQEQVLRIANEFAGMTLAEADLLRKAIGKKIAHILDEQRQRFIDGATKKGYSEKIAIGIFDEIVVPFSGYGFNRSHAACYAMIAYKTAYLRANFPVEFMATMMTIDHNSTDRVVMEMGECHTMKIDVLPPSINESSWYFTVIPDPIDPQQTKIALPIKKESSQYNSKIRFGLGAIKGLGSETVQTIMRERKQNGRFLTLHDLAKRLPSKTMNKKTLEALAHSGALDDFGKRGAIVASIKDIIQYARETQTQSESGQIGLFATDQAEDLSINLSDNDTATTDDILRWEYESLGFFVSDHPLRDLTDYIARYGTPIGKITDEDHKKQKTLHGLITHIRRITTRRGSNMAVLTIEDTSGKIQCAVFPNVYNQVFEQSPKERKFVRVQGRIDIKSGETQCIVESAKIGDLKSIRQKVLPSMDQKQAGDSSSWVIQLEARHQGEQISRLKNLLKQSKSDDDKNAQQVTIVTPNQERHLVPFLICKTLELERQIAEVLG